MKSAKTVKKPSPKDPAALLALLKSRFEKNPGRHSGLGWAKVEARLAAQPGKWASIAEMERTGGEPDVVGADPKTGEILFFDCSPESPKGRVSLCYDRAALDARKEFKPKGSALDLAAAMGVALLTEEEYFRLQGLGDFDTKSSSWLGTPADFRKLGGALFGSRRFGRVFIACNGAESYFGARGFRASLRV